MDRTRPPVPAPVPPPERRQSLVAAGGESLPGRPVRRALFMLPTLAPRTLGREMPPRAGDGGCVLLRDGDAISRAKFLAEPWLADRFTPADRFANPTLHRRRDAAAPGSP